MKPLSNLLQDADPVRHEPPRRDADRERIRQTMLRDASIDRSTAGARVRLRLVAAAVTIAIVVGVGLGSQWWTQTTSVFAAVRFEVRLAEHEAVPGLVVAQVVGSDRLIYLHPEIIVSNDDIAQSWVFQGDVAGFGVGVTFLPSGAERMQQATKAHVGRPLAILIDGRVVSVPILRSPISDSAELNGIFTQAEAKRIADGIGRP
jgi:hypothetical protein